jgi:hypothetical protein
MGVVRLDENANDYRLGNRVDLTGWVAASTHTVALRLLPARLAVVGRHPRLGSPDRHGPQLESDGQITVGWQMALGPFDWASF